MGIGTMTRGEKAMVFVTNSYLTQSPLLSDIGDFEEVQFEVELVHFVQVCLVCFSTQDWCYLLPIHSLLSLFGS